MDWNIKKFNELTLDELYEICKVRYEIFGCEQRIYQENDFDDIDKKVYHLFLKDSGKIVAYSRLIPSGITYNESSIGRVLVLKEYRRKGIAFELMKKSVDFLKNELNEETIVISSQLYVKKLYENVGFKTISDVYDEVDIPHVKMKL
ncbi:MULTISPECIES: GNAT family N-acetyltransferase [Clostridium]|uniref:GNAT family N-acetyltransferase n=1 Tax=Clostridium aquiflavi TaxID=3073603 RepID=A0ABU1EDJ0_9CLOT|nr:MULTISPECIES: GNAT family N-acetyltransferase [unclassified Clostridium]MDR5586441.1 GNAT family N-acetyltransferase [Clostridium sp. 5N-1]NFG63131.1 GNAT family N-acetyltransferase [Clostridium botulinum]NFQ10207.1 GNAT family N-acetyltransferase [Clostridium botulinum]